MACAYATLTGPQITQTPYTLHSFLLCSHSVVLVSRKAVKEFPVEAHRSLGLAVHVCVLYITSGSHQCHLQIISPWAEHGGGGSNQRGGEKYFPPEDLFTPPRNPSSTEHFLLLFLPLTFSRCCPGPCCHKSSHTHFQYISNTHANAYTRRESG